VTLAALVVDLLLLKMSCQRIAVVDAFGDAFLEDILVEAERVRAACVEIAVRRLGKSGSGGC
jgi:hypothetical protein